MVSRARSEKLTMKLLSGTLFSFTLPPLSLIVPSFSLGFSVSASTQPPLTLSWLQLSASASITPPETVMLFADTVWPFAVSQPFVTLRSSERMPTGALLSSRFSTPPFTVMLEPVMATVPLALAFRVPPLTVTRPFSLASMPKPPPLAVSLPPLTVTWPLWLALMPIPCSPVAVAHRVPPLTCTVLPRA